jgi:hypothetical protein
MVENLEKMKTIRNKIHTASNRTCRYGNAEKFEKEYSVYENKCAGDTTGERCRAAFCEIHW